MIIIFMISIFVNDILDQLLIDDQVDKTDTK